MTSSAVSSHKLLADIGGTNARFALADADARPPLLIDSIRCYRVADFDSLSDAAEQYLTDTDVQPERAVFAVAGRIEGDKVHATNNPWDMSASKARARLNLRGVRMVNDFAAMSMCVPLLGKHDIVRIGEPQPAHIGGAPEQTFAITGPGTGLGVGGLLRRDSNWLRLETEGGHTAWAPETEEEIEALRVLSTRFKRISNERVISGRGIRNLYDALAEVHGQDTDSPDAASIVERAENGQDLATRTLNIFCASLGSIAGDVALTMGAWDGVYLAGGMPPRLLDWLHKGGFRARFENKGRLEDTMREIPTAVITHEQAGLLGAAALALLDSGTPLPSV